MYERILVPHDGSEDSEAALVFVEHLRSTIVRILRVDSDDQMLIPPLVTGVVPGWKERHAGKIRAELDLVAERLRGKGRAVEVEVRFGNAADEIIASEQDADLVVMTTHGRGAAGRLLFGSTADRVAREGTVPTLLLRRGAHPTQPVRPERVVVPLDGSELAERALPEAEKLARVLDAPMHLVRAVGADEILATVREGHATATSDSASDADAYERARLQTERQAKEYLEAKATPLRAAGLTAGTELLKGTPAFVLLWAIQAGDVVVMSTHGLSGYRRFAIGSIAEKLVREAAGPVMLVRDRGNAAKPEVTESQSSARTGSGQDA